MNNVEISIDQEKCIGCMLCTYLAGRIFELSGEKARPKAKIDFTASGIQDDLLSAQTACPTEAISIEK